MTIRHVNIHVAEKDLGGRFSNPRILWHKKQYVFVEITTEDNVTGWGECWTFDQSADSLIRFLQTEIRPRLIGCATESIEKIWHMLWSDTVLSGRHGMAAAAISGIDCALWDIVAKRENSPVATLIAREQPLRPVPVYASGGLYRTDGGCSELAGEMRDHLSNGFLCVKMKFGALDFDQDLERIQCVRQVIGPDTGLIIDAVYSLDREKAERWVPHWHDLNIQAVQAPFPQHSWDDMRWLNQDAGIPVMVFEAENRYAVFRALLEAKAIGIMQFSPIAVGGVTAALSLIDLAEQFGCETSLQCSSTWLAEKIALQIGASRQSVRHVEIHHFHQYLFDHADPADRKITKGCHLIGSAHGHGFDVPTNKLSLCNDRLPDYERSQRPQKPQRDNHPIDIQ